MNKNELIDYISTQVKGDVTKTLITEIIDVAFKGIEAELKSGGEAKFDCPFHALAKLTLESYAADDPRVAQLPGPPVDPDHLVG